MSVKVDKLKTIKVLSNLLRSQRSTINVTIMYYKKLTMNATSDKQSQTEEMVANIMTKGLSKDVFKRLRNQLGVIGHNAQHY